MLTTIRPQTPQFAGKHPKSNVKKAGLIGGMLLASAGSVAALPSGHNGVSIKDNLNSTAGDSFVYIPKASSSEENPGGLHKLFSRDSQTEDAKAREILKDPASLRATDEDMFSTGIYPNASPMQLPPVTNVDEGKIREELRGVLTKRFKGDEKKAEKAIKEVFDDKGVKKVMPDPVLRATLTNLEGTTGRSAIDVIKNGTYDIVDFGKIYPTNNGAYFIDPKRASAVTYFPDRNVTFNTRYQGENFQYLSPTMAHETLHQDVINYNAEELVNDALTSTVYAQQLLENPDLALSGTELNRRMNSELLTRINSRDENGNLRLFRDNGAIIPGSGTDAKDFAAFYSLPSLQMMGPSSPGNANLKAMLKAVTGKDVDNPDFDQKTLALLDENQEALKPSQIVELARILKLDVPSDGTSTGTNGTDGNTDGTDDKPHPCSSEQNNPGCGQTSDAKHSTSVPKKLLIGLGLGVPAALLGLS